MSPTGIELVRDDDGGPPASHAYDDARVVAHLHASGRYVVRVATHQTGANVAYEITVRDLAVREIEPGVPVRARYEDARGARRLGIRWAGGADRQRHGAGGRLPPGRLVAPSGEVLARDSTFRGFAAAVGGTRFQSRHDAGLVLLDAGRWSVKYLRMGRKMALLPDSAGSAHSPAGLRRSGAGTVVAVLPADGRYQVRVATDGRGQGGAYDLTLHVPSVTALELNTPADGRYEDARGADVWTFHGEAGQIVRITAHGCDSQGSGRRRPP